MKMVKRRWIVIAWSVFMLLTLLPAMVTFAENFKQQAAYEYDANGRLCRIQYSDGKSIQYVYDKNGNIVAVQTVNKDGGVVSGSTEKKTDWKNAAGEYIHFDNSGKQWAGDDRLLKRKMVQEIKKLNIQKLVNPLAGKKLKKIQNSKAKIKKIKKYKNGKIQITLKKISGCSGYEIIYATNKKFKGAKLCRIKKVTKQLKLKKGKTYYIKARGYYTGNKRRIYTRYSKVKKIKIKG